MLEMESLNIGGSYFGFVSSIFGKIARNILPNSFFFRVIYHGRIRFTKNTLNKSTMQNIWMSQGVRINGDRINGLFHLFSNGICWGYNPLILTFDPNFQRGIYVQ